MYIYIIKINMFEQQLANYSDNLSFATIALGLRVIEVTWKSKVHYSVIMSFLLLKHSLVLPFAAATAAVWPASLTSASGIVAALLILVLIIVLHLVPLLKEPLPALGREAWRVVLALSTVDEPKEINVVAFHLQFCLSLLLHLLYSDEHNTVALHVPLTFLVLHPVLNQVVMLIDNSWHAHSLPLELHHLQLASEKKIFWGHLLLFYFKRRVVPGNTVSTALAVKDCLYVLSMVM
jgi:hypothetical protein